MNIDQVANADDTRRSPGTLAVEVDYDVFGTSDVVVVTDAAAKSHAAVHRGRHHYYRTCPTGGVERLVEAIVPRRCGENKTNRLNVFVQTVFLINPLTPTVAIWVQL